MSDQDSFIDDVTSELRRERLFGYLRRYGWIAVAAVLAIVGTAAWNEWRGAQDRAQAEAAGDALLAALANDDLQARATAIAGVGADGNATAVTALLTAAAQQEAGDTAAAAATLSALATNGDVDAMYRDLAAFKAAMLPADDADAQRLALEGLAQPGQPFRLLALEQLAYAQLAAGDRDAAIVSLQAIQEDAAVTRGLRERAINMMVALDAPLPAAATE